jgi:hypothetical protein
MKVHLYNLLGQSLGEFAPSDTKQVEIDVSSFKKGVYLLKVETGTGIVNRKYSTFF